MTIVMLDGSTASLSIGEIDYTGSISKRGDRRVRTLRYESARVVLTRYKGRLKLSQG
jgi:transposase